MMDDKAQMMVLESIIFAITILVSLIFLYQLSPTSTESNVYTNDLKIKGDDALRNLYSEKVSDEYLGRKFDPATFPEGYPKNKLTYYLLSDDYDSLILSDLKNTLPANVQYNIYVSNGLKKVFWCNSSLGSSTQIQLTEPVAVSHYMISIHPQFFNKSKFVNIIDDNGCEIAKAFDAYWHGNDYWIKNNYETSTYDVIFEMCYI